MMILIRRMICVVVALAVVSHARADSLEESFKNPPSSARPQTWWHWMNGNVTREGITADLEAMKRVGLGGFTAFHVTDHMPAPSVHAVGYMSDEWLDLMQHTIREADRLGLEMCLHNCAGWSASGGPWITPENSMQEIVSSETNITGGKTIELKLPQPQARKDFYRDIAIIAFPKLGDDTFRLSDWTWKIDRNTPGRKVDAPLVRDTRTAPANAIVKRDDVVVLTGKSSWDAPAGEWTIVRFGYTTTGRTNKPAPPEGMGLECNKLDRAAVKIHWDHSVARVIERAGPLAPKTFNNVLIDSYEVGYQNWTGGFEKTFKDKVGYDIEKFLPCMTGRIVDSVDGTENFLWDFRRLIADEIAKNYFEYMKELCHEKGLQLSIEPYNQGGFDYFQIAPIADVVMGEFWVSRPDAWHTWSVKLAASAAHASGRSIVGAESFTAAAPASAWRDHPFTLQPIANEYFSQGLNRIIFHTNVHEPWPADIKPGMTMGPHGIQMNRNNTWHPYARPWIDHLARTQFMLQQGRAVVDLCYLASEDPTQTPLRRDQLKPAPPAGEDYDMLQASFIMQMSVKNGDLLLPSGMTYHALILPQTGRVRDAVVKKISQLEKDGAAVIDPAKTAILEKIIPDFACTDAKVKFAHRQTDDANFYFVANPTTQPITCDATFRTANTPEIWHTEDARIERAAKFDILASATTRVPLALGPAESFFVVFRQNSTAPAPAQLTFDHEQALTSWKLKFPTGDAIDVLKLASWTDSENPDVKYFSGTATYAIKFDAQTNRRAILDLGDVQVIAAVKLNGKDLGVLWKPPFTVDISGALRDGENELEVSVTNLWVNRLIGDEKFPALAKYDKTGGITSIPEWLSKGEKMPATKRHTFSTWKHFKADDPLVPSGLIGPVKIKWAK